MDSVQSRASQSSGQLLIAAVLAILAALIGRLVYINEFQGPRLLSRAERQQQAVIPLHPRRGLIADCRGRLIAGTMLRKSVFADPKLIPEKEAVAAKVGEVLGVDPGEIIPELMAAGDRRFFVIRRGVSEQQAELIRDMGFSGLGTFDEPYRVYPMNGLAAQLIGFVSPDGRGVSGLEHQCQSWLRGEAGMKTIIRDAGRKAFWLAEGGYRPPRDGFHLVLTIDSEIQGKVERELESCLQKFKAESAVGIVLHASTGAILALANVPTFDPNHYQDAPAARYRNRAITDPYEPGSIFKPFVAAGALAEGLVRFGEIFDCENGAWKDGVRVLHDHHPCGLLSFEEVLIKSSNIGMGKIGKRMGNKLLHKYLQAFAFGEKTGVDLEGEDPGILQPLARWNAFTTTSIPMGQEIGVTPLQMVRAFAVFANGGRLVQPYVIRAVLGADGAVISDFTPPPAERQALPEHIARAMKDRILAPVVEIGTGKQARLATYGVFGKTGTAQIARPGGGGYQKDAYVSSFVAAVPLGDPQLVVLVSVTRPDKSIGYYGGTVAAPVVREIMAHALAYLQIPAERAAAPAPQSLAAGPVED